MALVNCPECGKENVSDTAVSCPECGYAVKEHFDKVKLEEKRIAEEKFIKERNEAQERHKKETAGERQKETISKLEEQIKDYSKQIKKSVVGLIVSLPLIFLFWYFGGRGHGDLIVLIIFCAIAVFVCMVFLFSGIFQRNDAVRDLETAKRNFEEYEKNLDLRLTAIVAQGQAHTTKNTTKLPKCPICGSSNTERISTLNRAASIATVGLASSKIGKQYQCKNCKHKW